MAQPRHISYTARDSLNPAGTQVLFDYLPGDASAQIVILGADYRVLIHLDAETLDRIVAWREDVRPQMPRATDAATDSPGPDASA